MRETALDFLRCLQCGSSDWELAKFSEDAHEIREGTIKCRFCRRTYAIQEGILDCLGELSEEVRREKQHSESLEYLMTADGEKFPINRETVRRFRDLFLSLPMGDGSHFFKPGGSFDNQGGNAERFFKTLELLDLSGRERILEVGSSFGWGAWRLAQRGCEVVAVDVTNYLMAADLYLEKGDCYFERILADMGRLPFCDASFDIVFSHSVIHHCKDIQKLFAEFHRVLRPKGRVVALHECAFGLFEDRKGKALRDAIDEGYNENAYTIPEWKSGARKGGFRKLKIHFFSVIDDYIYRKKLRGQTQTVKFRIAFWIQSHPRINQFINGLSIVFRILFRPKAWMLIATRS